MNLSEFELIGRLQELICIPGSDAGPGCAVGIGDDAAVVDVPEGRQLVVCTDTLVEGVHFLSGTPAGAVGHKALAVNLSDLAAMGAEPAWFFMGLTLPSGDSAWLESFAHGVSDLARAARVTLAGGDVASGPLNVCITALGLVESGAALTRSGARPGDLVVVSGEPGRAAHALAVLQAGGEPEAADRAALDLPQPRLALGRALRGVATACIDVSDGLLADLGHILESSGTGARIEAARLPVPDGLSGLPEDLRWRLQLSGGDDYELCFTVAPESRARLPDIARDCEVGLNVIGEITPGDGLRVEGRDGRPVDTSHPGYRHFGGLGGAEQ
ncbi:MAG: thiamine-phosphate kinase [Lysobacterales bacterium]|jgi:thiamine-monophosphate kinase